MAKPNINSSLLNTLQSSEQQGLLDEIDNLRLQGISDYIPLPQIVVCGDQSSGKSSVLEAISGVPFPRSDVLCTRFATEVVLRQAPEDKITVSITPGADASESDRTRLLLFQQSITSLDEFPELIERAKSAMGLSDMGLSMSGKAFSKHILRVEISGPNKPKLTVVDLPGLIHAKNKDQSAGDKELISALVQSYIENPRSVILAVVSAKNDIANQIILERAREVDADGLRTLGLITKPDTLPCGSQSEAQFLQLASNDNIYFRLGWHVVKNRDYATRDSTADDRDRSEALFFEQGVWRNLPRNMVGVVSLRQRLSKILLDQIKRYLPSLLEDVQSGIANCRAQLEKLSEARQTVEQQRQFLLRLSQSFQLLCKAAVDGTYDHHYFGDPSMDGEYHKRLRAVVQNENIEFARIMRLRGHHWEVRDEKDTAPAQSTSVTASGGKQVVYSRNEAIQRVSQLLARSRGRELPGSFNPLLVGDLFRNQSVPWAQIAREHVKKMWLMSRTFLEHLLDRITDPETAQNLLAEWVGPITRDRLKKAEEATTSLLADRERSPITYNHYYTETLQQIREERQKKELEKGLRQFLGAAPNGPSSNPGVPLTDIKGLVSSMATQSYRDMDHFACSELLDSMQAYYKVNQTRLCMEVKHAKGLSGGTQNVCGQHHRPSC